MPKEVPYFKADFVDDGKMVTKHFVQLSGLTEKEVIEVVDQLVEMMWPDVENDSQGENGSPHEPDAT